MRIHTFCLYELWIEIISDKEVNGDTGSREEWRICKPHILLGRFIEVVSRWIAV